MEILGLFHAWEANDSSLLNVLMPDGFPIAPQWISPILTAGLTATECLSASESAEIAPVRLHSCNVVSTPGQAHCSRPSRSLKPPNRLGGWRSGSTPTMPLLRCCWRRRQASKEENHRTL